MRVTLLCFCGITTGILVANLQRYAEDGDQICAMDAGKVDAVLEQADVVLLGPQLRSQSREIGEKCVQKQIPWAMIEKEAYFAMDGERIYRQAKQLFASR